jgi:prepilin-type processing-associated H-X9-DG protein
MRRRHNDRRAFTIVEMLVILAMIMFLLAMLLPTLGRVREAGRATLCGANLRQQGIALEAYANDNRGYYPGAHTWVPNGAPANWIVWPARLRAYAHYDHSLFWCPAATPLAQWKHVINPALNLPAQYGYDVNEVRLLPGDPFSYGLNNWGTQDFSVPQRGMGGIVEHKDWGEPLETDIRSPSKMIAIGDASVNGSWDAFIDPNDGPAEWPEPRHPSGKANILFCDGHVEPWTLEDLIALSNYPYWNSDNLP